MFKPPERIWIIGASSGIGRELAVQLSHAGHVLALSARRAEALAELNNSLGGGHYVVPCDVSQAQNMHKAAKKVQEKLRHIDRVIFMAAAYEPQAIEALEAETIDQLIDINLKGAFHVVLAILPLLKTQTARCQLALCGSVAGYRGLPNAQPYGATKAAIINLAESLRAEEGEYVDVRVINPGFVDTPMTRKNPFPMPMIISPEKAAQFIIRGLNGNGFEIHFPKRFTYLMKLLKWLPDSLYFLLVRRMV